jgi:hypothetical protein
MTNFLFGDGSKTPVYLTNQSCEVTHDHDMLLDHFSLPYGEFDGSFYPLTKAEEIYIADDLHTEIANGFGALMGYSALYQGEKFLMPSVEVQWGEFGADTEEQALEFAKRFVAEIEPRVTAAGGHVILDDNHPEERHLVQVLLPFAYAQKTAQDYDSWSKHLTDDLLVSSVTLDDVKSASPKI